MTPSLRERLPLFELSLILVAGIIIWGEVSLHHLKTQADRDQEKIAEKLSLLEKEATNWHQQAQRVQQENHQMHEIFSELRAQFTNELKGLETTQMEHSFKLNDAFKLREEYQSVAEHVESGIGGLHAALTNFVSRRTPAALEQVQRKREELRNWIAKQQERAEAERFKAKSLDLKEWIRREQLPATNPPLALTKDLGSLLEEIARGTTNYLVHALYVIDNVGKPITGDRIMAHLNNAQLEATQLFALARQARADGQVVQAFLQPQVQSEAQQKARRQQVAIESFLSAQARLGMTNSSPVDIVTNDVVSAAMEGKLFSLGYSSAFYPLIFAQIGLGVFLMLAIYRRVVEKLRLRLYESATENKLAHFEKLAVWQAHELKQPLTAITAWLWTLQQSLPEGSPEHSVATAIRKETDRLDQIVKDFLQLARPLEPKLIPVKAEPALREIQTLFQPRLEQQSIKLTLESATDVGFRADPQQLKQVLINLVQNAADSIQHDGSITLRTRQDRVPLRGRTSDVVIIEVEDDGPGIPPEVQERLFEPFFSTKKEGTGLGLPIAARIIDKHGGALEFRSSPGRGTVFDVLLPVDRDGG